jgi:putative copper resistance protein D
LSDPLVWVRFLHFAAAVSLSGLLIFHAFVGAPTLSAGGTDTVTVHLIARRLARLAWASLAVAVLTGAASLVVQAASMGERTLSDLWSDDLVATVLLDTDFGHVWLVRFALVVLLAFAIRPPYFGAPAPLWRQGVALILAAAFVAALAFAGHAAAGDGVEGLVHQAADVLHLIAAAAWVGALVPLAIVLGAAKDDGVPSALAIAREATLRFSTLGIASVGTVLASGIVNTFELTGSWAALFGTGYGRLLLVKIALFLAMLAIAAVNRMRLTPQLVAGGAAAGPALRQLRTNALTEAIIGALILFIVAMLGTLPPGREDVSAAVAARLCPPYESAGRRPSPRKVVEPRRIVDEDAPARRLVAHPLVEQLEQMPGIGHLVVHAWMRPVAAPNQALGVGAHQRFEERPRVRIIRRPLTHAVGAGHLDPAAAVANEAQQALEARRRRPVDGIGTAHVVDHDRAADRLDERHRIGQVLDVDPQLHVPAELRHDGSEHLRSF